MRIRIFVINIFFITLLVTGCKQKKSIEADKNFKKDSTESQTFFPVTRFILGELAQTEALPVTPLKITTINGKADSVWLKKEDIRPFAQPFLHPVIDTSNLKELFGEKSFLDQTINAYTFSFDPMVKLPDTMQLRRWDVYIDPQKNKVTRIYLVKQIDSLQQTIQLTWMAGRWCKITIIKEQPGKQPEIKEEKMIWDFTEPQ